MNCREARDLLLEADRPDLLGEPTTELGRHVTACPVCSAMARRIRDTEASLDRALAGRAEVRQGAPRATRPLLRRWRPLATWGSLAVAALVVLVLVPRQRPPAEPQRVTLPNDPVGVDVDVSSSAGQTAVVLRTTDPTITVVWYFQN